MGLLAYLVAGGILLAMLGGGALKAYNAGKESVRLEWSQANEKARAEEAARAAAAAKELEDERAKKKVVYRTITQTVDRYIDRPIYRNVCFDADGLRDANAALSGKIPDPAKPDGPVPAPDATH